MGTPAPTDHIASASQLSTVGYQGFGSFHNEDNVEFMASNPGWQPPPNHCQQEVCWTGTAFGATCRSQFFIDFDRWTFLNHGAFGAVLRCAHEEADAWRRRCESQPLRFLDRELFAQLVRVMGELAAFVGCQRQDLVLLPNATTGLNVVIQSLRGRIGPGDVLFHLDVGYGSVKKMLQVVAGQTGAQVVQHTVQLPLSSPSQLVGQAAAALPEGTRLAVFDAVTSNTAIVLPIQELVQLCHSRDIEVLIDGAHALGMLPLDLRQLGADYFVANCHKWLSGPRGSAMLHVQPKHQRHVHPVIVSHGYGSGFVSALLWDGNRDYAPLLAVSAALRAWQQLGSDAVRQYQRKLLRQAVELLTQAWGTGTLVPLHMCGSMALVQLPGHCLPAASLQNLSPAEAPSGRDFAAAPSSATSADAKHVQDALYRLAIECPVKCIGGKLFVRISVHIYNELDDFEKLAAATCADTWRGGGMKALGMKRCLQFAALLALLAVAAAPVAAVTPACPSLLTLVEKLPDSLIFAELLAAAKEAQPSSDLQAKRRLLTTADPLPAFRACPRILSPVCATDGRQFANDCVAASYGAEVACRGPCPCGATASSSSQGPVDPVMGPCPVVYAPVCGVNGRTYQSKCYAGDAKIACQGACPCGQAGRTRELLADGKCSKEYVPVCGADQVTYANACMAGDVEVACTGPCPCSQGPLLCPAIWAPVCGVDNKTYGSACAAGSTKVDCQGECPCKQAASADDVVCFSIVQPVCGTDGKTYTNQCFAQAAGVAAACSGECPCPDLLKSLETRGGLLLVPDDDTLLAVLDGLGNSTGSADAVSADELSNAMLRELLARHIILMDAGQSKPPAASKEGTPVMTEAGQQLQLFADGKGAPKSVSTGPPQADTIPVLSSQEGCKLAVYQIPAVLDGPAGSAGSQ
ncbi:putative L-cysteine desulfhydrase 1 [Chlorella vulgaris]